MVGPLRKVESWIQAGVQPQNHASQCKKHSAFTHIHLVLQTHLPREPRCPGAVMITMDTTRGFVSSCPLLKIFFPPMWRKHRVYFSEKNQNSNMPSSGHASCGYIAYLGQVTVTEERNPRRLAIQASRNTSAFAISLQERSMLSCVTKRSCYDPAGGGGHFPGNKVTDGH